MANPSLNIVQELDIFTIVEELVQSTMENMTPRKRKRLEDKKISELEEFVVEEEVAPVNPVQNFLQKFNF